MFFNFRNKKITGILAVVPPKAVKFEDEVHMYNFPVERSLKLKEVFGYEEHRIADPGVTASDLAVFAMEYLINKGFINKDQIDGLLFFSHTPDYILPPTANIIQGRLSMKTDMLCLDINQGCAGFLFGLIQAFMMLDTGAVNKVALINADTFSRKVSPKDRNSYPLIGDAASVTIIENGPFDAVGSVYTDGSQYDAVIVPAGGARLPSSPETAVLKKDKEGNERALDHIVMNGIGVFNFVQVIVPQEIKKCLQYAGVTDEDIFAYCCHQPNKFLLDKLADKLKVDRAKMPSNIAGKYGNSNSVTIPLVVACNYAKRFMKEEKAKVCFAGFGDGLVCSSIIMDICGLEFCEIIEYRP